MSKLQRAHDLRNRYDMTSATGSVEGYENWLKQRAEHLAVAGNNFLNELKSSTPLQSSQTA